MLKKNCSFWSQVSNSILISKYVWAARSMDVGVNCTLSISQHLK